MPLKMINTEEQVTEVITEVAEQIDVKAKQREAILAFLSGKDTFVSLPTPTGHGGVYFTERNGTETEHFRRK